ncbi:MAG: hypothetical protein IPQ21_17225 [Betaproteobacteria bacterium]|nr:hypothetical protein [Betaproteobacteria bacterium]
MKFLVDAQLPRRMCAWLASCGLRCPQVEKAFEDSQFVELGAQHLSVRD